jgi:hypothetical protein
VVIIGAASSIAARAASSSPWSIPRDVGLIRGALQCGVGRVADFTHLFGHAADGCDDDAGHQGEQTEDDQACGQAGLELVALEDSDQGFEDHGQNGRERHREHDLADCAQRDAHDDGRHHEPYEAPRQRPDLGSPAEESRGVSRSCVALGGSVGLGTPVGVVGEISGLGHAPLPPAVRT